MNRKPPKQSDSVLYFVDEAGDGVLFGPKGRNRLTDKDAPRFFMLGMVQCEQPEIATAALETLRKELMAHPLYASIPSMRPAAQKTALGFHAKDDHPEVRAKVFELLLKLDFKFHAVIKEMRAVLEYVNRRNKMHPDYRYHPNELYDLTVRLLFKQRVHNQNHYQITFARRGQSDRTKELKEQIERTRLEFSRKHSGIGSPVLDVVPAYPWEQPCLQIADYCLWAVQRCYERHEARFLEALWSKVSLLHDVDDPNNPFYGTYLTRKTPFPNLEKIKNRWI